MYLDSIDLYSVAHRTRDRFNCNFKVELENMYLAYQQLIAILSYYVGQIFSLIKFLVFTQTHQATLLHFSPTFLAAAQRLPFLEDFNVFSSGKQRNGNSRSSLFSAKLHFFFFTGQTMFFPAKLLTHVVAAANFKKPRNVNKKSLKIKEQMTHHRAFGGVSKGRIMYK